MSSSNRSSTLKPVTEEAEELAAAEEEAEAAAEEVASQVAHSWHVPDSSPRGSMSAGVAIRGIICKASLKRKKKEMSGLKLFIIV